jgi:transposase-like protein
VVVALLLSELDTSMKRHSVEEIASKLRRAEQLMAGGQSQAQACKELGVSVMTYHRWRKLHPARDAHDLVAANTAMLGGEPISHGDIPDQKRIDELRIENERLRRIVTDLLLEKVKVEEQIAQSFRGKNLRRN